VPTYEVFELPAGLLDDAVLALEDDAHAREVSDLGLAHDERVCALAGGILWGIKVGKVRTPSLPVRCARTNVEAPAGEDTRHAREHTRLVLHEAVEQVAVGQLALAVCTRLPRGDDATHRLYGSVDGAGVL
jgi:hypothetical protein